MAKTASKYISFDSDGHLVADEGAGAASSASEVAEGASLKAAVAYALDTLQERGRLFVSPGDECYEGMIVGESAKEGDMVVNVEKSKSLGNQRSSSADKAIQLTPPITFTLEEALEYIEDDELVEVTPQSIRLRKRLLNATDRKKAAKK